LREPEEESRARTYSLEILDRHTLQLGTGALAERGVALLLLTLLQGEDALFDGVGDDEPVDKDLERAAVIGRRSARILRGEPGVSGRTSFCWPRRWTRSRAWVSVAAFHARSSCRWRGKSGSVERIGWGDSRQRRGTDVDDPVGADEVEALQDEQERQLGVLLPF
jgi:hypothetical protein